MQENYAARLAEALLSERSFPRVRRISADPQVGVRKAPTRTLRQAQGRPWATSPAAKSFAIRLRGKLRAGSGAPGYGSGESVWADMRPLP